ncbi:MAG: hypothetical protein V1902_03315 [Candidatus Falkowbacteria bacterium]
MKKNITKKGAVKKVVECADGNGAPVSMAVSLETEFAAQIAGAVAVPAVEAEELGRKAAAELVAKQAAEAANQPKPEPKLGDVVVCIGLDCGCSGELSRRTLVVRDSETIQPICPRCEDAACRANLALLPYGIWQERKDKFSAKVEELRGLDVAATGGSKKDIHAVLLDLSEEELDKAQVVSLANVPVCEIRGMILPNKFALSAFFRTHLSREYFVDEAAPLLERFEKEEREAKKQEEYFRRIADAKRTAYAAKGARRQQGMQARVSQFANMASGGNGGRAESISLGNGNGLKHSPFAGLNIDASKQ